MRRRRSRPYSFNFDTPCPGCSYAIPPAELLYVDGARIRCPRCGLEFIPAKKP